MTPMIQTIQYNYDLTSFKNAESFKNLLEKHGLTESFKTVTTENRCGKYREFVFYHPEKPLVIATSNHPITGELNNSEDQKFHEKHDIELEKGNCGHVAIRGEKELVEKLVNDFEEKAASIKDGGKDAGFKTISDESLEKIPQFEVKFVEKHFGVNKSEVTA